MFPARTTITSSAPHPYRRRMPVKSRVVGPSSTPRCVQLRIIVNDELSMPTALRLLAKRSWMAATPEAPRNTLASNCAAMSADLPPIAPVSTTPLPYRSWTTTPTGILRSRAAATTPAVAKSAGLTAMIPTAGRTFWPALLWRSSLPCESCCAGWGCGVHNASTGQS